MRKALVVGIDYYENIRPLFGCVRDAHGVRRVLERHGDGTVNFGSVFLAATDATPRVKRSQLRDAIVELFRYDSEVALFYFAGHGYPSTLAGCSHAMHNGIRAV